MQGSFVSVLSHVLDLLRIRESHGEIRAPRPSEVRPVSAISPNYDEAINFWLVQGSFERLKRTVE